MVRTSLQADAGLTSEVRGPRRLPSRSGGLPAGRFGRVVAMIGLCVVLVALATVGTIGTVSGATTTAQWQARVGAAGANGTSTIKINSAGTGSISIALKGLAHSTTYTETVYRGTCSRLSTKLLTLPTFKSTATGTATRTNSLTATQASAVNRTGVVIRLAAGKKVVCGAFTKVPLTGSVTPTPTPTPTPSGVSGVVGPAIPVDVAPFDVAVTPTAVWVTNGRDTLSKVDPVSNTVLVSIPLDTAAPGVPFAIAVGDDGSLWVSVAAFDDQFHSVPGSVVRVNPTTGQIMATVSVGRYASDIATSPGAVWLTNYDDGTLLRIDPATNQVAATITLAKGVTGVAFGEGAVWVTNEQLGTVTRIDPATNQIVTAIPTVGGAEGVAVGGGAVWVANYGSRGQPNGVLSRIDPATNQVTRTILVGTNPVFVAYGGGYVWVSLNGEPAVVQVNAQSNAIQARLTMVGSCWGITATDHTAWVVQQNEDGLKQ